MSTGLENQRLHPNDITIVNFIIVKYDRIGNDEIQDDLISSQDSC